MRARKRMSLAFALAVIPVVLVAVACKSPAQKKAEAVESAQKYMAAGEYGKAIIEYKNAIKIDPRSAELQYKLGQVYVANGQLHEGFLTYDEAIELDPDYVPVRIAQGRLYLAAKQFDEALKDAEAVLPKNPDNTDVQILLADAYAGKKNFTEATKVVQGILKQHPDSIVAHLELGMLDSWQGKADAALQEFERAVSIDPNSLEAREALAAFYFASQKQFGKAEEQLRAAVAAHPDSVDALQALAIFYLTQKRFSEAEPLFKNLVKLRKNSPDSRFALASFYLQAGNAGEARKLDEDIARTEPSYLPARLQLAEMALAEEKYDNADRLVAAILKDRPKEPRALVLQARISLARKNPQKAVQELENAQRLDPNLPALHYWEGMAYRQQGNLDLAQHGFEQALSLNEHYVDAHVALAQLALDRGQPDKALGYAQQASEEDPRRAVAHFLAGSACFSLKDMPKAEAEFQAYIELEPGSPVGPARLGYVHLAQRRYNDAEKDFEKSLALDPKGMDALNGLVTLDRVQGQNEKAIARIRQQIAQRETADLYNFLGKTYADLGQFGPAEQSLKRALELDPQNFNTYGLLGTLYYRQKDTERAITELEQATKVSPKSVGPWTGLGVLHSKASQPELAQKDYETALAIDPNAAIAANNLAWLYCEQGGDLDKALELAHRARHALPNVPRVSDTLAWVYYKRQLYDSAIPLLQEAVRQQPKDAQIRFHLAASLLGVGKEAEARQELDAALKLDASLREDEEYKSIFGE